VSVRATEVVVITHRLYAASSPTGMPGQSARRRRPGIPKVVLDSQRIVSLEAARRLNDSHPEIAAHWRERSETYGRLVHQTRDVGGPYGNGGLAAGQGSVSVARIQRLPADGLSDADNSSDSN